MTTSPRTTTRRPKASRSPRNVESSIQAAIVAWVRLVAPQCLIFACPNGGYRTKAEAAKLKWTGTLAGVPDLILVDEHGLIYFLEVKQVDGRLSDVQCEFRDLCRKRRWPWAMVTSINDVRDQLAAWNIRTRESTRGGTT